MIVTCEFSWFGKLLVEAGLPAIEADNCIFHDLAMKSPEVCEFDIALLSGYTGSRVERHERMARGGPVCRFRFPSPSP